MKSLSLHYPPVVQVNIPYNIYPIITIKDELRGTPAMVGNVSYTFVSYVTVAVSSITVA